MTNRIEDVYRGLVDLYSEDDIRWLHKALGKVILEWNKRVSEENTND